MAFPHALPPVLSTQRLLTLISTSSQEIQVLTYQNSEQTKLASLKIIYDKDHRDQRIVNPLTPSGLIVLFLLMNEGVCLYFATNFLAQRGTFQLKAHTCVY